MRGQGRGFVIALSVALAASVTLCASGQDASETDAPDYPDVYLNDSLEAADAIAKARRLIHQAPDEDAAEIRDLVNEFQNASASHDSDRMTLVEKQLENIVFYLDDA